jgi:hypothetical protein
MTKVQYTTRVGTKQWRPVFNKAFENRCMAGDGTGFCLACGATAHGVEPDARKYVCESCEAPKVYGLEELVMMGLVK